MSDRLIDAKKMKEFVYKVLLKAGVNRAGSKLVASSLVEGELYGFYSHGVMRLAHYLKRVKAGTIKKDPKVKIVKKTGCTALVDGGQLVLGAVEASQMPFPEFANVPAPGVALYRKEGGTRNAE